MFGDMPAQVTDRPAFGVKPRLDDTAAQGRFGVDIVQLVCASAGYGCEEPRSGEDVRAIDATVKFDIGTVQIQVKCVAKEFSAKRGTIRIPVEDRWVESWKKALTPIYLVVVKVGARHAWIDHSPEDHSLLWAPAYWTQIHPMSVGRGIVVHRSQRFTEDALRKWANDLEVAFGVRNDGV